MTKESPNTEKRKIRARGHFPSSGGADERCGRHAETLPTTVATALMQKRLGFVSH